MKTVREKLELRRKNETSAIEERKNAHIKQLMKDHEQEFSEIKNYYNDITHNNLDLIKSLKDEVAEMKKKEQADEQKMNEIYNENRRMSEPLKKAQKDVEHLNVVLTKYKKEKEDLKKTKARLVVVENQYQSLKWQHQVRSEEYVSTASNFLTPPTTPRSPFVRRSSSRGTAPSTPSARTSTPSSSPQSTKPSRSPASAT